MKVLCAALILILPLASMAQGCYLCLTEAEARQAADSALLGQSSVRALAITRALYVVKTREAVELRRAMAAKSDVIRAQDAAIENLQRSLAMCEKERKRKMRAATRKTFTLVAMGVGAGFIVGTLRR